VVRRIKFSGVATGATKVPTRILQPETPDRVAASAVETPIDLHRWRTAVELADKLKEAGIKCRVTLVPAKRRD